MRHVHSGLLAAMVLITFTAPAFAQRDYDRSAQYDSSFTTRQSIAPGGTIRVENLNGSIDVEASDNGTTTVSAVKRWTRGDPARVRILVEPGKNGATVCALWEDERSCEDHPSHNNEHHNDHSDVSVRFTVRVAKGVKVDLNTVNGSVDVSGATAAVDAETVNGRVEVATLGEVGTGIDQLARAGATSTRPSWAIASALERCMTLGCAGHGVSTTARTSRPAARAASTVSSEWLMVPSPGRAAITTGQPRSSAKSRTV